MKIINLQLNKGEMATIKRLLSDEIAEQQYDNQLRKTQLTDSPWATEKHFDDLARRKLNLQKLVALAEKLDKVLAE